MLILKGGGANKKRGWGLAKDDEWHYAKRWKGGAKKILNARQGGGG